MKLTVGGGGGTKIRYRTLHRIHYISPNQDTFSIHDTFSHIVQGKIHILFRGDRSRNCPKRGEGALYMTRGSGGICPLKLVCRDSFWCNLKQTCFCVTYFRTS